MVAEQKQKNDSKITVNAPKARQDSENCFTQSEPCPIQKAHAPNETKVKTKMHPIVPLITLGLFAMSIVGAYITISQSYKKK